MAKIRQLLLVISLGIFMIAQYGCSSEYKKLVKAANKQFDAENFKGASELYQQALAIDSLELKVNYKSAEANRLCYQFKDAEKGYSYVSENDPKTEYPQNLFWLAMTKKSNGKYAEAMTLFDEYFNLYLQKDGENNYFVKKSELEIQACAMAKKLLAKAKDTANVKNIGDKINTSESEFAPFQYGSNILYYSVFREEEPGPEVSEKEAESKGKKLISRIYKSYLKDSAWSEGQELDYTVFNNLEYNTGNVSFSSDLKRAYFTRCEPSGKTSSRCEIFVSKYVDGEWQEAEKLNDEINVSKFSSTTPFIASNGTKGEILYFSSDRPGGEGKYDLWYCSVSPEGEYSKPTNLGPFINSIDNEITPYYDAITQTLYFSSDWHKGLGGFDIFKSRGYETEWEDPVNLGFPFNTSADDTYFSINQDNLGGYFTSRRVDPNIAEGSICCNDIFSFKYRDPNEIKAEQDARKAAEDLASENSRIETGNAIRALIPVTIFFHNDEPDSKSASMKTNKTYDETYKTYSQMREEYVKQFVEGIKDSTEKITAEEKMRKFFSDYIDKGYNSLELFSELLLENLDAGRQVTITLKGYTSPLNSAEYNKSLAQRRIISLLNYFDKYQGERFIPYLKGKAPNKGFLTFIEDPIGESDAPPNVSDDPKDIRNSIYNPDAGAERRVQILSISIELSPEQMDKKIEQSRKEIKESKLENETPKEEVKPVEVITPDTNVIMQQDSIKKEIKIEEKIEEIKTNDSIPK